MSMSFLFFFLRVSGSVNKLKNLRAGLLYGSQHRGRNVKKKDLKNKISLGRNPLKGGRVHTSTKPSSV